MQCSMLTIGLDPDPGGKSDPHKQKKKLINFTSLSTGCSLLRAEGFSCSLDVLFGGLEKQFAIFDKKNLEKKIFRSIFFFNFWSSKPWIRIQIRIRIHLNCWIRSGSRFIESVSIESGSTTLPILIIFVFLCFWKRQNISQIVCLKKIVW